MTIQLNNCTPEQVEGLHNNFESDIVISPSEDQGRFDVTIEMNNELDAWKLFFSGSDYCLAKFKNRVS